MEVISGEFISQLCKELAKLCNDNYTGPYWMETNSGDSDAVKILHFKTDKRWLVAELDGKQITVKDEDSKIVLSATWNGFPSIT